MKRKETFQKIVLCHLLAFVMDFSTIVPAIAEGGSEVTARVDSENEDGEKTTMQGATQTPVIDKVPEEVSQPVQVPEETSTPDDEDVEDDVTEQKDSLRSDAPKIEVSPATFGIKKVVINEGYVNIGENAFH